MSKKETRLSRKCQKWVESSGGNVLKLHGNAFQRKGEPDHIGGIIVDGRPVHFAIELKVDDNTPSKLQVHRLREWERVGFKTGIARTLQEYKDIIYD